MLFSGFFVRALLVKGQAETPGKGALESDIHPTNTGAKGCLARSRQQILVRRIVAEILRRNLSKEKDRGGENTLNF